MYKSFSFFDPAFIGTATAGPGPAPTLYEAMISSASDPFDACGLTVDTTVWISDVSGAPGFETVTVGSKVHTEIDGTITFVGDGQNYKININGSGINTSSPVDGAGAVSGSISLC